MAMIDVNHDDVDDRVGDVFQRYTARPEDMRYGLIPGERYRIEFEMDGTAFFWTIVGTVILDDNLKTIVNLK